MSAAYVEIRSVSTPEQLSLDIARHLPHRATVGTAVVLTERPRTFLPTIRKRWMTIVREVDRQRSSTLDHFKRSSLEHEARHMRSLRFQAAPSEGGGDVFVINPEQLPEIPLPTVTTIYIATVIPTLLFAYIQSRLASSGVIVTYLHSAHDVHKLCNPMLSTAS